MVMDMRNVRRSGRMIKLKCVNMKGSGSQDENPLNIDDKVQDPSETGSSKREKRDV